MFSLRSTIIVLIVLLLPFLLRLFGEEPYPAVLLPSNPGTVERNGHLTTSITHLLAVKNGQWTDVDQVLFFAPVPVEYMTGLLQDNLGLKIQPAPRNRKSRLYARLGISPNTEMTAGDLQELKTWIKNKLAEQGFETARIRVMATDQTISLPTGFITNNKMRHDNVFSLD